MIGVEIIPHTFVNDDRGYFKKIYSATSHESLLTNEFKEIFYSKTLKHCVRGFHLQTNIAENQRLIRVIEGSVRDYLLDLRPSSATYGEVREFQLDENSHSLLVPPGVAHAFYALETSTLLYATTSVYTPKFDTGVRFDSVIDTTKMVISQISTRDLELPTLQNYQARNYE
jgi:dTDP-4-dehydrorhamnose 3,5-epimerase